MNEILIEECRKGEFERNKKTNIAIWCQPTICEARTRSVGSLENGPCLSKKQNYTIIKSHLVQTSTDFQHYTQNVSAPSLLSR